MSLHVNPGRMTPLWTRPSATAAIAAVTTAPDARTPIQKLNDWMVDLNTKPLPEIGTTEFTKKIASMVLSADDWKILNEQINKAGGLADWLSGLNLSDDKTRSSLGLMLECIFNNELAKPEGQTRNPAFFMVFAYRCALVSEVRAAS